MGVEIERKWVPSDVPPSLGAGRRLRQGYLPTGDGADVVTVRVRIIDDEAAELTIKAGGGLARTEVEVDLTMDQAEALWAHTAGRRIDKIRHRVELGSVAGGPVAEVDLYAGALAGLCTVEVEFDAVDDAERFVAPPWFGTEVTGDERWSNAALSSHGRPDRPDGEL